MLRQKWLADWLLAIKHNTYIDRRTATGCSVQERLVFYSTPQMATGGTPVCRAGVSLLLCYAKARLLVTADGLQDLSCVGKGQHALSAWQDRLAFLITPKIANRYFTVDKTQYLYCEAGDTLVATFFSPFFDSIAVICFQEQGQVLYNKVSRIAP